MSRRKEPAWAPPSGLKIEVCVSRGDCYFKAEAAVADALNVARLLTAMARQLTADAPDLLPTADSVPGTVIGYDWDEEFFGGGKAKPPKPVGF
jgi:hypothetical protein